MVLVILISLLSCMTCIAQLPVIPFVTQRGGSDIPTSLGGMSFRLKSADLVKSNTVVQWVDEIHGYSYTNHTGANQPTNSWNLGVWFQLGNVLSNDAGVLNPSYGWAPTQQLFIAFQAISPSGFGPILGNHSAETLIGYLSLGNIFGSYQPASAYFTSYPVSAVNYVVIGVGGGDPVQFYTNGVAANNLSGQGSSAVWDMLGCNQNAHSDQYQGYVKEIIFWTNTAKFSASPYAGSQVSNLFFYATNQTYLP